MLHKITKPRSRRKGKHKYKAQSVLVKKCNGAVFCFISLPLCGTSIPINFNFLLDNLGNISIGSLVVRPCEEIKIKKIMSHESSNGRSEYLCILLFQMEVIVHVVININFLVLIYMYIHCQVNRWWVNENNQSDAPSNSYKYIIMKRMKCPNMENFYFEHWTIPQE